MRRSGFNLVELLISIAIIGTLIAILLPAVQAAREAARRTQCKSNLHQIGVALQNYESNYGTWPSCGSADKSWHVSILPQIDRSDLYQLVDSSVHGPSGASSAVTHISIPLYICPTDPAPAVFSGVVTYAATNYLGCSGSGVMASGYDGMFRHFSPVFPDFDPEGPVRLSSVTDGLSNTIAVTEVLHSLGGYSTERLRLVYNTPDQYTSATIDEFKEVCATIPQDAAAIGWMGSPQAHGWRWTFGEIGFSTYNHMLTPMQPSCFNHSSVQDGIYTASSSHGAIVFSLFADGHVSPVPSSIDAKVWKGTGTRSGSYMVAPDF